MSQLGSSLSRRSSADLSPGLCEHCRRAPWQMYLDLHWRTKPMRLCALCWRINDLSRPDGGSPKKRASTGTKPSTGMRNGIRRIAAACSSIVPHGNGRAAEEIPPTRALRSRCVVRFASGLKTEVVGVSGAPRACAGFTDALSRWSRGWIGYSDSFAEWRDVWEWYG